MRIAMVGHKRVPSREGGIEVVVEELAARMVIHGHTVTCYNRSGHHVSGREYDAEHLDEYRGIRLKHLPTIDRKGLAAVTSSFFGCLAAAFGPYNVVHVHAEGPAMFSWIPRLTGKRVILTIHGLDWARDKWKGSFGSWYIRMGEKTGARCAHEIIVLNHSTQKYFLDTYGRTTHYIPNGVNPAAPVPADIIREKYGLEKDSYILYLGRMVPEKGCHYLVDAFKKLDTDKKLVIAGGSSASTSSAGSTAASTAASGTAAQGGGDLVIYSPNSEGLLNATIPLFEEKYGVNVELIQAGTGELVKRIQSEKNDPYADVLFGGSWSQMYTNEDLWEPYVSANDANVIDAYKNKCGFITGNVLDGSVLIVNTDLIGDIKIEGYEDLLNPALKGKIATADPANSSSAFAHLTNMLLAMGGYEDDKAWQYVHDLFENVDGKICESSSGVYKGVADGEYVVGLSYEDPCAQLVLDGAPVKIVYMKEGTVFLPASATIIKGAKNMDNAKLFIDFILSEEVQNIWGSTLTNRPVMKDAATNDAMTPMADINVIEEDIPYVSAHKSELVDKYTEIFTDLQSK